MPSRDWQRILVIGAAVTARLVIGSDIAASGVAAWRGRDPALLSSWLNEPDQEQLADSVSSAVKTHGWAAGCLWPSDHGQSRIEAVTQLGFERDDDWVVSSRRLKSAALLILLRHPGPKATGDLAERSGDGFFCYVPEAKIATSTSSTSFRTLRIG